MNFNEYQKKSRETWITGHNHDKVRAVLGLVGESGEVAEKFKKKLRGDDKYSGQEGRFVFDNEMLNELGDIMYYVARMCDYSGFSLEDVAVHNIDKLFKRKAEGKIKGSGDNR